MKNDSPDKNIKKHKKRNIIIIVIVCFLVLGAGLYQGYRVARDILLEKLFVMLMENEETEQLQGGTDSNAAGGESDEQAAIDIYQAAEAFERLNGVDTENKPAEEQFNKPASTASKEEVAKDIVSQIPEADKNRAVAIVSSVASVDDCIALYNLAMNGDENAKSQLKSIYGRFTQAQKDELWALYEKNKHLL